MDAYHPHIPFPKSDYFPNARTDGRTNARTEFGNLILCAPTYRALRAKTTQGSTEEFKDEFIIPPGRDLRVT